MSAAILKMLPRKRGRQTAESTPAFARLFPRRCEVGKQYVYAVAFKGDVVKIGVSNSPRSRVMDHWKRGAGEVEWAHLFRAVPKQIAHVIELGAERALQPVAKPINSSEWYSGDVRKEFIVKAMREVIAERLTHFEQQERVKAANAAKVKAAAEVLRAAGIGDVSVTPGTAGGWGGVYVPKLNPAPAPEPTAAQGA